MGEIVLLDTESDFQDIKCISIPLDESFPPYYAISYRWGVHPEWKAKTPNYVASITSISQGNLIKLCQLLRCQTRYLWIDVVCINQADIFHRKMAIKNMDNIYRQAKRIIAVPDLCYCDENPRMKEVTKEDIEMAVDKVTYHVAARMKERDLDEEKEMMSLEGIGFIRYAIEEWANRCWVISERTIGVKLNKLDVILLRANGAKIPYRQWQNFPLSINWNIIFNQFTLIKTILECKSTKYIDRLFAILPHTKYRDAVQQLVDEERTVENMTELKVILFDILDEQGKEVVFRILVKHDFRYVLPSFVKEEQFLLSSEADYTDIQRTVHDGKPALKFSALYVIQPEIPRWYKEKYREVKAAMDIFIFISKDVYYRPYEKIQCVNLNGLWMVDSMEDSTLLFRKPVHCKYENTCLMRHNGSDMVRKATLCAARQNLVKTILESKSIKPIDRLFAILPQTKRKEAVRKLLHEDRSIDNMIDLKVVLMDVLDMEGKVMMLRDMIARYHDFEHLLPLSITEEPFQLPEADDLKVTYVSYMETTTYRGKQAVKPSEPYSIWQGSHDTTQLEDTVLDVPLDVSNTCFQLHRILRYVSSGGIWFVRDIDIYLLNMVNL
ncbi:hypothetical protein EC973_005490 [Apophysomyces ossiformis]|uniref:Heterokaryon incompatibility domain-containing protein n=1 Tax=Apophysomyces ossiformis TaxID=679940 RepID=A0A8H7BKD8_9FUNG|nr:hypothetical protein EC973_005490 [Apophysomyces ossiformis]